MKAVTNGPPQWVELPLAAHQLGRIDGSQKRAIRKAEDFLIDKLQRLL
jgi:hypothetical protein